MPFRADDCHAVQALEAALDHAVREAALARGYTRFISGMSTGFDLWAAESVLRARESLPVQLLCAVPFDGQADRYPADWKRRFNRLPACRGPGIRPVAPVLCGLLRGAQPLYGGRLLPADLLF